MGNYYTTHKEELTAGSILNVEISQEQVDYVLFYLSMEQCMFQPRAVIKAIPLRGWADQPDHPQPIPDLKAGATLDDWLRWAEHHNRGVRSAAMEWLIMDPSRGVGFTEKLCSSPSFRGKFGGLYATVTSALQRLGHADLPVPDFIRDKIARVKVVLAEEERFRDIMRREAEAREVRVSFLRATLERAEKKDWMGLVGFEANLPPLPKRPATKRARRAALGPRPVTSGAKKRKRSLSRPPVSGGHRPALGRTDTERRPSSVSRLGDRSRSKHREYPPRSLPIVTRARSSSRPPTEAAVHREADEHRSFGRVSKVSAKRGRMSDLLYDTVQERTIQERREVSPAREQEQEAPRPVGDEDQERVDPSSEREFINNILDENILDLDVPYEDYRILYESD